jgi:drug/metabolite transporter (DMT)-like permease
MNMHLASTVVFALALILIYPESIAFDRDVMLFALLGGMFFAVYHLLVVKAYQLSDVSQVYPITTSAPLFVTIWAMIFLGERIPFIGVVGILVTVFGCLVLNGASLQKTKLQAGVIVAFLAAFAYSFGALFDKLGVNTGNPVMYTFAMNTVLTLFIVIQYFALRPKEPKTSGEIGWIWLAGVVIVVSSLAFRFGLEYMQISYAVALRQISGLFGVIMGVMFFNEGYGKMRVIGTLIVILGIALLKMGIYL